MSSQEKKEIEPGPILFASLGIALFLLGAWLYFKRGHFGWDDLFSCALAIIPAVVFLFVFSYVFQHARLAAILPAALAFVLLRGYPSFGIALGLVLTGTFVSEYAKERSYQKQREQASAGKRGQEQTPPVSSEGPES